MSEAPTKSFDPTESVRTLSSDLYTERNMTLREHQDTDLHYIGDSLPVPSTSQAQPSGLASASGSSPFPARADHTHEDRIAYGYFSSTGLHTPPGQTFINNFTFTSWGRDSRASGQIILFPFPGLWFIQANLFFERNPAPSVFQQEMNILFFYNNGSFSRTVLRQSNFDLPSPMAVTVTDWYATTLVNSAYNMQVAVQHNDVTSWWMSCQGLVISRLGSYVSI